MESILNLWNTKRWLFWCLLPIVVVVAIIVFGSKIVETLLPYLMKKDIEDAEKKDAELNQQIQQDTTNAEVAKAKADAQEEKIKERTEDDVSEDWYKTYKPKG